ncbi:hypothetical protein B0H13DRAFT_2302578 [Mycena leptocephala]|nr:hypothetical protein B0H13DRAFT_2302578 [Mycena leptocephala]
MSVTSPLGDATNASGSSQGTPAAAPTLQDIDSLRAELESMKTLVAGFTKKTRKRKRNKVATNDSDAENDAPASNKPKTSTSAENQDFSSHGRIIGHFLGPYTVIEDVITHGLKVDTALEGDEHEEGQDECRLYDGWKVLYQKFPGFHELMLKNYKNLELIQSVCREMNKGMEGARSDTTGTLKQRILSLLDENPQPGAKVVVNTEVSKATRAKDPKVVGPRESIASGDLDLNSRQLPNFLFPFGQLDDVSALETILTGPVMLRSAKAMYMGPASPPLRVMDLTIHQGKPGVASIIALRSFTDRVIAGVGCQVRFNLSSVQHWNKHDGRFNYEEFFWMITIALYNRVVLGHASGLAPLAPTVTANAPPPLTHLERLQAARAAQATANSE